MAASFGDAQASAVDSIQRLSHASGSLTKAEMRATDRVAEVAKEVMLDAGSALVMLAAGRPMLSSKSADGTPVSVAVQQRRYLPSGSVVRRSGRHCVEYLVKNQFLRTHTDDGCATRVLLQDPQPLVHGKKCDAIFSACKRGWVTLRTLGHEGCAVEHYCYDRMGIDSHARLWRQWHQMTQEGFSDMQTDVPTEILRLTEFMVVTPCAAHDAQSAFRWGMQEALNDKDLLRDAYVGVESLRNSMDLILGHVAEWAALRLSFKPEQTLAEIDARRALWQALDVEVETADILAETLQLDFEGGRLRVVESQSDRPDLVDLVTTSLLSVWKFVRWSESRFLTVGRSSRTMVASFLTGIEDMVTFICKDTNASRYYINGFGRLTATRKQFLAECAFVSRVTDGVLAEIMEDPRVAMRYDELYEV